ncbi:MAG: alpha/beta hydrolase [Gammaproteobacteria bacterium]|nr:alpha/beta hydrolase [Gammaproteobacteria bacterium]MBI5618473.1 alpha/beta hydrolase [Gammaproteobacteria bacterium]
MPSSLHGTATSIRVARFIAAMFLFVMPLAGAHPLGPPPGELVDIGGHRLHLYCEGHGSPTVMLEAGLGGASLEWTPVMERVRRFTRACVYDRAGYGWSDPGPLPRVGSTLVSEFFTLVRAAKIEGPLILVGHSYGGYLVQLFARLHPDRVAGLVLVDASHPSQVERFEESPYNLVTAPTSRVGMVQFREIPIANPALPPRARLQSLYQQTNWKPRRAMSNELLEFRDSAAELRAAPPLGPLPLVVLSRGQRVWPRDAHGDLLERLWLELQSELAVQSPQSAHLLARDSGHMIHLDQPDLVAYAVALLADLKRAATYPVRGTAPRVASRLFDFNDATWLDDSLDLDPGHAVLARSMEVGVPVR